MPTDTTERQNQAGGNNLWILKISFCIFRFKKERNKRLERTFKKNNFLITNETRDFVVTSCALKHLSKKNKMRSWRKGIKYTLMISISNRHMLHFSLQTHFGMNNKKKAMPTISRISRCAASA